MWNCTQLLQGNRSESKIQSITLQLWVMKLHFQKSGSVYIYQIFVCRFRLLFSVGGSWVWCSFSDVVQLGGPASSTDRGSPPRPISAPRWPPFSVNYFSLIWRDFTGWIVDGRAVGRRAGFSWQCPAAPRETLLSQAISFNWSHSKSSPARFWFRCYVKLTLMFFLASVAQWVRIWWGWDMWRCCRDSASSARLTQYFLLNLLILSVTGSG